MKPSLSIVIPVYNSAENLPPLIDRLVSVLPTLTDRYEVVLVNDGSRDGSWEAISALAAPLVFWAARAFAPTRPMLAGAAAGLLTGGLATTLYGLHCPADRKPCSVGNR